MEGEVKSTWFPQMFSPPGRRQQHNKRSTKKKRWKTTGSTSVTHKSDTVFLVYGSEWVIVPCCWGYSVICAFTVSKAEWNRYVAVCCAHGEHALNRHFYPWNQDFPGSRMIYNKHVSFFTIVPFLTSVRHEAVLEQRWIEMYNSQDRLCVCSHKGST